MERQSYRPSPEPDHFDPRVEAAIKTLYDGYDRLLNSDEMRRFFEFSASFYRYSPNNQVMIWMQRPDATKVAGFRQWQAKYERHVKRGERAIKIWAPMVKKELDDVTGEPVERVTGFRVANVFDIKQTEGKPVPHGPRASELTTSTELGRSLYRATQEYLAGQGVPVFRRESARATARGEYIPGPPPKILVHPELADDMAAKTLIHEGAHHAADHRYHDPVDEREAVAEGAAFVTGNYFGLDTEEYSLAYIVGWCRDQEVMQTALPKVQSVSRTLIEGIEQHVTASTERPLERDLTGVPLFEGLPQRLPSPDELS